MRLQGPTGAQGKLDRKAKDQGVLGVVGNPYVQSKQKSLAKRKPKQASQYNASDNKMRSEMERRAI